MVHIGSSYKPRRKQFVVKRQRSYSEHRVRYKLGELNFEYSNKNHPFDDSKQIQPCSVDLRLDNIFWKPRRRSKLLMSIDLRKSQLLELSPRHYWKDIILRDEEYIEIKSGEFILGIYG